MGVLRVTIKIIEILLDPVSNFEDFDDFDMDEEREDQMDTDVEEDLDDLDGDPKYKEQPARNLRKTEAFFKQRHDALPKNVKNRADNLVQKLKTITGMKFDSGCPPVFTSNSGSIDKGKQSKLDMSGEVYSDIIDKKEDLGVSVRVTAMVLRFHIKMRNKMAKYKD